MVNRTGTYFAFDGLGEANPAKSDFRYYAIVQKWDTVKGIEFKFVNSHEKAGAVRDTSKKSTLEASILQRLRASKNMVAILSDDTRKSGSMLSFEIEKAVDTYKIPLILAYTDCNSITNPSALSARWPTALQIRIKNRTANAIHVAFKKDAILDAIGQFTVNSGNLTGPLNHYSHESYQKWGYVR